MQSRHIVIGAMMCLLFLIASCDTMDDVKKMESETNNLTLVYASDGGGGGGKVCQSGALILSMGGSHYKDVNSYSQIDYYVVNVTTPGRLRVYTSGLSKLIGELDNSNCDEMISNGDWSGDIILESDIITTGKYWVRIWASDSSGTSYTIFAEMI
jgi:hypothetical protein